MSTLPVTPENRGAVIASAAALLRGGGVVLVPTDTVYGLAGHPDCPQAVARLYATKGRPAHKPIALLAAGEEAVRSAGAAFPPAAARLAAAFWPGALTLVLPCRGAAEGFRVPDHPFARDLLAACGGLLRVTSANRSGALPAASAAAALRDIGLEADLVVDDGSTPGGAASTVVRVTAGGEVAILRAGAIPEAEIRRVAAA
jgi:L-threonylcarbamoyladenylate synthase